MSDFLFVQLRSFFSANLAKRWKVQLRQGLHNLMLIKKRHKFFFFLNDINRGHLRKETLLTRQHDGKSPHEEKRAAE